MRMPGRGDGFSGEELEQLFAAPTAGRSPLDDLMLSLRNVENVPVTGGAAALRAFREHRTAVAGSAGSRVIGRISRWTAAFGITGGLLVAGGVAAAATGHVPHAVSHAVSSAIDDVFGGGGHHSAGPQPPVTPNGGSVSASPSASGASTAKTNHGAALHSHPAHPAHPTHPAHPAAGVHPVHPAHPAHPAHPGHPAHPTKKAHPGKKAHPTKKPHPTTKAHPTHPTKKPHPTHPAHPTKKPHPTPSAMPTTTPISRPTHTSHPVH